MFTIHKHTPYGFWFHDPNINKSQKEKQVKERKPDDTEGEEMEDIDPDKLLKVDDFEIYMNPRLLQETKVHIRNNNIGRGVWVGILQFFP